MSSSLSTNLKKIQTECSYPDLFIKVGKETLNAHRGIVSIRCEEICPPPQVDKKKKIKDKTNISMKSVSNSIIFNKILEYLYSGSVLFGQMNPESIMELNKAAKIFNLKRLSYQCESYFEENISLNNVYEILTVAHKMNEPVVKSLCKYVAVEKFNDFVMKTEGLHVIGIDLLQEIITAYLTSQAQGGSTKPDLGAEPKDTLRQDMERLFKTMPYADCKFIVEGKEIICHKGILSGVSEPFKTGFKEMPPSGMVLKGISLDAFNSMLKYIYYGEETIDPLPACELVGFARDYGMNDLQTLCENKIRNSIERKTVIEILEVAYQPEMAQKQELVKELKSKTFPFVAENFGDINLSTLSIVKPRSVMIAADLLLYLQDVHRQTIS